MFSKKPNIHIDKIENLDVHSHLHPFVEELLVDLLRRTTRAEFGPDERWPIKGKFPLEPEPSTISSMLDTTSKFVSIVSGLSVIVFAILLWRGQTSLGSVNITNLLAVVSVTFVGGLVSIGGVRIFSFQASLRRMQQIVKAQSGCPFVPLPVGKYRRDNRQYRPGNPQFCVKCPLGIDTSSNEPEGLIHNCKVYPELNREWRNTN